MSDKGQKNSLNSARIWEFHPDFNIARTKNNPLKLDKKAGLKRGKPHPQSHKIGNTTPPKVDLKEKSSDAMDERKLDRKKSRNAKESERRRTGRSQSANDIKTNVNPSSAELTTRSMSPIPAAPLLNSDLPFKKFAAYSSKILDQFELVKIFVTRPSETADSLYEVNRQRKRANEFSVRFSRNSLYQMKRLINEIKQIIVPNPFDSLAKSDSEILSKKLLLAYQTATQALQTYINYMKNGQSLDVPEKTRELVMLIVDLSLCCEHLSLPVDQRDVLSACKELVLLLDSKIAEASGKTAAVKNLNVGKDSEKEDKRFSMYKTKLTNSNWKKKTEALAKIKFGAPRLSYLKKMKKNADTLPKSTLEIYSQKIQDASTSNKKNSKVVEDNSIKPPKPNLSDKIPPPKKYHSTPREVTSQDLDDIETVVQSIEDEDISSGNRNSSEAGESNQVEFYGGNSNFLHKNNVRDILLQTIQEIQYSDKYDVQNSLKKLIKSLNCHPMNLPELSQPRNVKVIHIISNEPIPEEPEEESPRADSEPVEESIVPTERESSEGETEQKQRKPTSIFKSIASAVTSPKQDGEQAEKEISLKMPQETSNAIIKYKKMLSDYRRSNVMYKRGIPVRPCELVLRISDQIINDILTEISCGMANDSLLKQLYYNELLEAM